MVFQPRRFPQWALRDSCWRSDDTSRGSEPACGLCSSMMRKKRRNLIENARDCFVFFRHPQPWRRTGVTALHLRRNPAGRQSLPIVRCKVLVIVCADLDHSRRDHARATRSGRSSAEADTSGRAWCRGRVDQARRFAPPHAPSRPQRCRALQALARAAPRSQTPAMAARGRGVSASR
jgi:hypothetical protein